MKREILYRSLTSIREGDTATEQGGTVQTALRSVTILSSPRQFHWSRRRDHPAEQASKSRRSVPARRLIRVLEELIALHGRPAALRLDNGPELTAQTFAEWCDDQRIALRYIQHGKPDQNAFIERFNHSYHTEVLDAYLFESLAEARALTER